MVRNKPGYKFWLPELVGKICIFLFTYIILVFLMFILGNFQNFMDSTEIMLLKLLEFASMIFILSAIYFSLLIFWLGIKLRNLKLKQLVLSIISLILILFVYLITKLIQVWIKGF